MKGGYRSPHLRSIAACAAAAGLVLAGIQVHLFRLDSLKSRAEVGVRLARWERVASGLEADTSRDPSFRSAYVLLLDLLNLAETIDLWQDLDPQVPVPLNIRERLESAHTLATQRASTPHQVRRLGEVQQRYHEMLAGYSDPPTIHQAHRPEPLSRGRNVPRG